MGADNQSGFAEALLRPRAVAVVGASGDPAKTTSRPQRFLRQAGFTGSVYLVNPGREEVLGERCHPSLTALPEVPDHVFVLTNAEPAIETVRECAALGVPVATILASGFGEEGAEGLERQERLRAAAREGGVRLIGPSSLGVVNPRNHLLLTANAAFDEELLQGELFVASQSGSMIGALVTRGKARGIGFAGLVSVGGEADVSIGALCEATVDDPGIGAYALFMESLQHTEELASFAHAAHRAGKPVVVYKLGRSEEAAQLSVSHTGALAGEDSESDAFFRACGFARVDHLEALFEAPSLLRKLPPAEDRKPARVGVITTTGGGAAIMVDQLATRGVQVVAPSEQVLERFAAANAPVAPNLIADLTLAGAKHELVRSAIEIMQDSGEFDLVCFVIGSSARNNPELAVKAIAECANGKVPLVAFALPDAMTTLRLLDEAGVAAFRTPEACADAIDTALNRTVPSVRTGAALGGPAPSATRVLDEQGSAELLGAQGVARVPSAVLDTAELGEDLTLPFDYPVVVKALSDRLPHKTEAGAVVLDVADAAGVREAVARIKASVAAYDDSIEIDRVLVQRMAAKGVAEALVGYRVSPSAGPLVVLAAGGIYAELYSDSTVRLAPVDAATAREMIGDVRGLGTLAGFRGAEGGDVDALVDTIVAVSNLAADRPDVVEAEVNPLSVGAAGDGAVALDALVRLADRP
ncbi:acetate--CoA ligase family protein [Prauserella cavernicola]|uniref:Acetate--CoA ligase family protein n=1 Tax=Prauserella cavernicola TaxID=2800127 RepID=A0A934QQ99_9PSEU|nr:acetate--CoA ligase family protein [Prauserella cavernicola]MBK1784098.1 acetate--CoA ligase family protein [Prauserella cavernicola]